MLIACGLQLLFSVFLKILLDNHIDNYLRKIGHKSLAKRRGLIESFTHLDIIEIIPNRYILYNFTLYGISFTVVILTVISFFVSVEAGSMLESISRFIIIAEIIIAGIDRVFEVLFGKNTSIWNKVLLVICIVLILLLVLIK